MKATIQPFLWIFFFSLIACSTAKKIERPFYYEVLYKNKTYYVLGTMHVGFAYNSLPEKIHEDLKLSDILRVEVTSKLRQEAWDDQAKKNVVSPSEILGHYPDLKSKFDVDVWKHLSYTLEHDDVKNYLVKAGVKHPSTEIHPYTVILLTNHFINRNSGYVFHPELLKSFSRYRMLGELEIYSFQIDKDLERAAVEKKIPVQSLDTREILAPLLSELKKDPEINYIKSIYSAKQKERYENLMLLSEIYLSGDEETLASKNDSAHLESMIFTRRNEHWFNVLSEESSPKIFVAVGALHLVGKNSLLELFRKAGAKVTRVTNFKK